MQTNVVGELLVMGSAGSSAKIEQIDLEQGVPTQSSMKIKPANEESKVDPRGIITNPDGSYFCHICMESNENNLGYQLSCQHMFCQPCLESYMCSKITDANLPIKCFYPLPSSCSLTESIPRNEDSIPIICNIEIPEYIILDVLTDQEQVNKYQRFKFMKENANARECPKCGTFNTSGSDSSRQIICENSSCNLSFCFAHADAHPSETCEQYESRNMDVLSTDLIATSTKPCPGCGAAICRDGGCTRVTCSLCRQLFCWDCQSKLIATAFDYHACTTPEVPSSMWWRITVMSCVFICEVLLFPPAAVCSLVSMLLMGWCARPASFQDVQQVRAFSSTSTQLIIYSVFLLALGKPFHFLERTIDSSSPRLASCCCCRSSCFRRPIPSLK